MTPRTAFVLAALWAALAAWGPASGSTPFLIGGLAMAAVALLLLALAGAPLVLRAHREVQGA